MHVDAAQKPSTRIISEGTKGKTEFSVNITHERTKQCNVYTRAERWKTNERSACEMNQSLNALPMVKWRIANRRDKPAFLFLNVRIYVYIYRGTIVTVSIDTRYFYAIFYSNPKIPNDYFFSLFKKFARFSNERNIVVAIVMLHG